MGEKWLRPCPSRFWPCDPWRDRWSNGAPLATPSHALLRGRCHWRLGRHSGLTTAFTSTRPLCDSQTLHCTSQRRRRRGRRGTKYVVCNASLTQAEWLREGYECLVANAPDTYFGGDFFLFDSDGWRARWQAPLAYQDFVANLRGVVVRSVAEATEPAIVENREAILRDARRLTGHSPRPTIPTAVALGGSDSLPIQLQGKWKSQGMVQKYIRDRGRVVLSSVRQIAAGLR